jgi:hypothetical protein
LQVRWLGLPPQEPEQHCELVTQEAPLAKQAPHVPLFVCTQPVGLHASAVHGSPSLQSASEVHGGGGGGAVVPAPTRTRGSCSTLSGSSSQIPEFVAQGAATFVNPASTCAGVAFGFADLNRTAAPATCGDAMLVPLIVL